MATYSGKCYRAEGKLLCYTLELRVKTRAALRQKEEIYGQEWVRPKHTTFAIWWSKA